ncbi:MAG: glycosyl hydrolase family 28-related protein [Usitatibacter sp.]
MDRRRFLAASAALPAATVLGKAPGRPPGAIDVRLLGARGDGRHDDSGAFQSALDRARVVWVPAGSYLVGDLALWSHTRIQGEGHSSVLLHKPGSSFLAAAQAGDNGSADPRDNVRDIALADLALHGRSVSDGFFQTHHLLALVGASRVSVERCLFRAFQGDGVYVGGSGLATGVERHNEDIVIRGCVFDGVNFENRQGVSVTDATRATISGNLFRDCSRFDMPGAVDIEPEAPFHRVRDVRVIGNRFVNVLGMVGAICVILAEDRYDQHPNGIEIRGNRIEGRFKSLGIVATAVVDGAAAPRLDLRVTDNEILDTFYGFEFSGVHGVRFERNHVRGTSATPVLSLPRRGRAADVVIARNRFEKVGMHSGVALKVHPTAELAILRNRFVDCGWIDRDGSVAIDHSEQPPGELRMEGNVVIEPSRRVKA